MVLSNETARATMTCTHHHGFASPAVPGVGGITILLGCPLTVDGEAASEKDEVLSALPRAGCISARACDHTARVFTPFPPSSGEPDV